MKKNRMTICGRNTITLPTPPISPSFRKLASRSGSGRRVTMSPRRWNSASIASMPGCAQAKTAWNITNRMASSTTRPATGCRSTASTRVVRLSGLPWPFTAEARIRSASRWAPRRAAASGAVHEVRPAPSAAVRRRSTSASSASVPPRRTATEVTTGRPSSRPSFSVSISMPRLRAMSIMLSDSITGRPTCFSSSTRRRARRRLEASATHTMRSGITSFWVRPRTTSRVTSSSGERARSE